MGISEVVFAVIIIGLGNSFAEHGQAVATIPRLQPEDVLIWSAFARPECKYDLVEQNVDYAVWKCSVHKDCNARISWIAYRTQNKPVNEE